MAKRAVRGASKVRRLLKRLPQEMQGEMIVEFYVAGRESARRMQAGAPQLRGRIRAGIGFKVFSKTLRLQVGIVGGKKSRSRLFYAHILDQGRRAQTVQVVRGGLSSQVRAAGGRSNKYKALALRMGVKGSYTLNVPAIAPMRFISGEKLPLQLRIRKNLGEVYERALKKAAVGAQD